MKIVCLDPGHDFRSVNRSPDGSYYEWEFNQDVCNRAEAMLKKIPGIICIKTKNFSDFPVSLEERVKFANEAKADLFISQHSNAYGDGKEWTTPNGFGVYCYPGRNLALAQIGLKWCQELIPMNDRGVRERNFHVLRETKMPSILFETGFHTNKEDVAKLKTPELRELAAKVLVQTTCEYLEVTYREVGETKYYVVQPGDSFHGIAKKTEVNIEELLTVNQHIQDPNYIYAEYGGDIIFLEKPSQIEAELAAVKREIILTKINCEENSKIITRLQEEKSQYEKRINECKNIGKQISELVKLLS